MPEALREKEFKRMVQMEELALLTADIELGLADVAAGRVKAFVTGGFRSDWGADRFAAVRSIIGTAKRRGTDACQAIRDTFTGPIRARSGLKNAIIF